MLIFLKINNKNILFINIFGKKKCYLEKTY